VATCLAVCAVAARGLDQTPKPKGHPKVTVRASPALGLAPLRVVATAELVGGADDDRDYYCPKVEWRWGDDTVSTTDADCDPYEPGKSEIRRHYSSEHRFVESGVYEVAVIFKQGDKAIDNGHITIRVQGDPPPATGASAARSRVPGRF
jgi:hypothetical protein